ncbi:16691_t:CDS:2, partial [Funneliformis caledonium]
KNIVPDDSSIEVVDLTSPNTTFDDDIGYEDALEDELITRQPKCRKININIPQNYLRFKSLKFASKLLRIKTHEQLKDDYQIMKNLTNEDQETESRPTLSNSLLARMFQNDHTCIDEISHG